ncbi:MAG: YqeG family HAD IIIA-type phosphatase [Bacilli bacterium]|nr:YqeG family HAD IIIA-type phosphatase [Bacilli bacterium]
MKKKPIWFPTYRANSIFEIPVSFYAEHGIKVVLSDLDNTLDDYRVKTPSPRTQELVKNLKEAGIDFYIASNNNSKRVSLYGKELGIKVFSGLMKPFSGPLKKLIEKQGFKKEEVVLIGDQVLTDVKAGNKAGIMTILTEPISKGDIIWTRFNRVFEKKKRKKILSENYNLIGR